MYAERMVDRLLARVAELREFSERDRQVPEAKDERIREVFEGPYRVIYVVQENRVDVLAVVHGRAATAVAGVTQLPPSSLPRGKSSSDVLPEKSGRSQGEGRKAIRPTHSRTGTDHEESELPEEEIRPLGMGELHRLRQAGFRIRDLLRVRQLSVSPTHCPTDLPAHHPHSARIAITGSTAAARRAGMYDATAAASSNTSGTTPNVTMSAAGGPNSVTTMY